MKSCSINIPKTNCWVGTFPGIKCTIVHKKQILISIPKKGLCDFQVIVLYLKFTHHLKQHIFKILSCGKTACFLFKCVAHICCKIRSFKLERKVSVWMPGTRYASLPVSERIKAREQAHATKGERTRMEFSFCGLGKKNRPYSQVPMAPRRSQRWARNAPLQREL